MNSIMMVFNPTDRKIADVYIQKSVKAEIPYLSLCLDPLDWEYDVDKCHAYKVSLQQAIQVIDELGGNRAMAKAMIEVYVDYVDEKEKNAVSGSGSR